MDTNLASAWPQPEWNDEGSLALALQRLREAHDESSANEASDQFLWAVGNNHTGTFYPVVLAALPELEKLLVEGSIWAQRAVLESLIDLGGSFVPEEGHELHDGVAVQRALQAAVGAMRVHVLPLSVGNDARARSAVELIELIDDQAG
ncbi:hypothetical protein ACVNIS_20920 [Sphaerotilaceae bacterium SBD11-9]